MVIEPEDDALQGQQRKFQKELNARGPYYPLMQPTQVFVTTADLKNAVFNAVYQVDITRVSPA